LTLLAALALASAAPLSLPPIDTCAKDRSFVEFRTNLRRIIERRDSPAMVQIISDGIVYGLPGQNAGRDGFLAGSKGKQLSASFWNRLRDKLKLGCVLRDGRAMSPSFEYQLEGFDTLTSTLARPGAVVRSRPDNRAPIVARSNWLVLTELEDTKPGWIGAELTNGRKVYIKEGMTAATGERVWFKKLDGRWVLAGWVYGD
jgi:hypothetical protein